MRPDDVATKENGKHKGRTYRPERRGGGKRRGRGEAGVVEAAVAAAAAAVAAAAAAAAADLVAGTVGQIGGGANGRMPRAIVQRRTDLGRVQAAVCGTKPPTSDRNPLSNISAILSMRQKVDMT